MPGSAPRPRGLWRLSTKNGNRFLDRPSSPWRRIATQRRRQTSPSLSFWNIGCSGDCFWKLRQKASHMSPSLSRLGFTRPAKMWVQLFWIKKRSQSLNRRKGIRRERLLVFKKPFRIGMVKPSLFDISRSQSLSPFLGFRLAKSKRLPDFPAAASPTSATKSRAVRMAAAQEASAKEQLNNKIGINCARWG